MSDEAWPRVLKHLGVQVAHILFDLWETLSKQSNRLIVCLYSCAQPVTRTHRGLRGDTIAAIMWTASLSADVRDVTFSSSDQFEP
jgi:hypothetical protein